MGAAGDVSDAPEIGGGSGVARLGVAPAPDGGARLIALPGGASVIGTLAGGTGEERRSPRPCATAGPLAATTAAVATRASQAMAQPALRQNGLGVVTVIAFLTEKPANSSLAPCGVGCDRRAGSRRVHVIFSDNRQFLR